MEFSISEKMGLNLYSNKKLYRFWKVLKEPVKKKYWKSRTIPRINVIKEYKKNKKDIDAVYVPVMGFGTLFLLLKKLGFIHKPVIGVAHSMNFGRGKCICLRIIFLSERALE